MLQRYFWWLGFKKNKWKRWREDEASETEPNCERPVEPGAACRNPPTCLWCRKQGVGEVALSCRELSPGLPHSFGSYNNGDSVRSAGQRPRDQWEKLQIPKWSHVCTCDWFMAKAPRQLMERGTHHGEGGTGTIGCKYEKKKSSWNASWTERPRSQSFQRGTGKCARHLDQWHKNTRQSVHHTSITAV